MKSRLIAIAVGGWLTICSANASGIEGLWFSETTMDRPAGDLVVTRINGAWQATFDGETAQAGNVQGNTWLMNFPHHATQARIPASASPAGLDAFWIQDGDQGQALASPMRLHVTSSGRWQAAVPRLDLRFTLFANVFRREDGALIVAFRNPQRNTRGGAPRLFVEQRGPEIRFLDNNEGKPGIIHEARLAPDGSTITMPWPETGDTVVFRRATPQQAQGFLPRGQGPGRYAYVKPEQLDDGWPTAPAMDVGMKPEALERAVQRIIDTDPSGRKPDLVHSLSVAYRGRLVLDEYFYGQSRSSLHDMRSAGKTLSSIMLGTQIRDRVMRGADERIMPILAASRSIANPSRAKDSITLAQLMTHTSGLACNDNDENSPGNEDRMQSQPGRDWWAYIAGLPMVAQPGTRYAYCSGGMNLVGAALTLKSGLWLPALFHRTIAEPLRFGPYAWNLSPDGEGYMGGGARLRPRDLLKLGQLYLDKGLWNGQRIVPEAWVAESTSPRIRIDEASTGLDTETLHNTYAGGADGYAWHLFDIPAGARTYRSFEAAGNGGQMVVVVPELSLAVALTGGNFNQGFIWGRWRDEFIGGQIIPAIVDK